MRRPVCSPFPSHKSFVKQAQLSDESSDLLHIPLASSVCSKQRRGALHDWPVTAPVAFDYWCATRAAPSDIDPLRSRSAPTGL